MPRRPVAALPVLMSQAIAGRIIGAMNTSITNRAPVAALPEPSERARLRILFDVTQTELAKELSVTRKTVYAWEHGTGEPTGKNRRKYAAILASWARAESAISTEIKNGGDSIDVAE